MQNLNQRDDEQKARLETKRNRAHRIQRKIVEMVKWLMEAPWCEEAVLEQSSSCRSLCQHGIFGELKHQCHGALVPGCQWGLKSGTYLSSKSWYLVTKTRSTADALGAKSCPGSRYHKALEGAEVTLSAGYTAQFRRTVVDLVLAPENGTCDEALALFDKTQWQQEGAKEAPIRAGKTALEFTAPVVAKFLKKLAASRFPRVGPTPQNIDGEAMPDQRPVPAGPPDIPLVESPYIVADRLQRGAEDPQRKLTQEEQEIWTALPEGEKKIAEATVAKLHADLEHSSVRQMIGALRTIKAHPSIVAAAKLYHCSACFESERRRLRPVVSGKVYAPGSHLAGDQFEWAHPTKDLRVLGTILMDNGSRAAVVQIHARGNGTARLGNITGEKAAETLRSPWTRFYGRPETFHSDPEGCFASNAFREDLQR